MLKFKQFLVEDKNMSYFGGVTDIISFSRLDGISLKQIYSQKIVLGKLDLLELYYDLTDNIKDSDKKSVVRDDISDLEVSLYKEAEKHSKECEKILQVAEALVLAEAKKYRDYVFQEIANFKNQYQ